MINYRSYALKISYAALKLIPIADPRTSVSAIGKGCDENAVTTTQAAANAVLPAPVYIQALGLIS